MAGLSVFLVALLFTGIILVVLNQTLRCQPVVQYRYLPRPLDDYLRQTDTTTLAAQDMFEDDAWLDAQGASGPVQIAPLLTQDTQNILKSVDKS